MSRRGTNPVLEPIRSWVLWSKTRLALVLGGSVVTLVVIGNVFGSDDTGGPDESSIAAAHSSVSSAPSSTANDYRMPTSTNAAEDGTNSSTDPATALHEPNTAAAGWVNTWYDQEPSDERWAKELNDYALPGVVTDTISGARPDTDGPKVTITGHIRIEYVDGTPSSSSSTSSTGSTSHEDRPAGGEHPSGDGSSQVPTDSGGTAAPPFTSARSTAPTLTPTPSSPSTPPTVPAPGGQPAPSSPPAPSSSSTRTRPPEVTGEQIAHHGLRGRGAVPVQLAQYSTSSSGTGARAIAHVPLSTGKTLEVELSQSYTEWRVAALPTTES